MTARTMHIRHDGDTWATWTNDEDLDRHSTRAGALQSALLWAFVYRPASVVLETANGHELVQYYPDRSVDPARIAGSIPAEYC